MVAVFAVQLGTQCLASGVYIKHVFEQLAIKGKSSVLSKLSGFFFTAAVALFAVLTGGPSAKAQNTAGHQKPSERGERPSPHVDSLGPIESGENLREKRRCAATSPFTKDFLYT